MISDSDIIGTPPARDAFGDLPLFAGGEAEAEAKKLREQFVAPPPKPPRATAVAAATPDPDRQPFAPRTQEDRDEAIAVIKAKVVEPLIARALERKDRFEAPGITADDVHDLAKEIPQVALLGQQQRAWSWVGPWLAEIEEAGAVARFMIGGETVRRASTRPGAHGNLQIVYLHAQDHRSLERRRPSAA